MEQLNIVGKRSGDGFVAHKSVLVSALSRALAERVVLMDFTIGRKGFLKSLPPLLQKERGIKGGEVNKQPIPDASD